MEYKTKVNAAQRMGSINSIARFTLLTTIIKLNRAWHSDLREALPEETEHKIRHDMEMLLAAGLVEKHKDGNFIYFTPVYDAISGVAELMREFLKQC